MNLSAYMASLWRQALSPAAIYGECFIGLLVWAAYVTMRMLLSGQPSSFPDGAGLMILNFTYWLAVCSSCFGFVVASVKSSLPPLVALLLVAPFVGFGLATAAFVALALAMVGTGINALSFAVFGSRFPGAEG